MDNPETPQDPQPSQTPQVTTGSDQGKTIAIISYLTWLGWIIALVMHSSNKSSIGAYHLRQTLMLHLTAIAFYILQFILFFAGGFLGFIIWIAWIGLLVLWVMGFISAINGEEKPIPLIGEKANEWFGGAFK